MDGLLIKYGKIVNEGSIQKKDILIQNGIIQRIDDNISLPAGTNIIYADGKYILPGVIDTHVHFREPGLTAKADFASESAAAAAGGITSIIDMPNTVPQTTTMLRFEKKMEIAKKKSVVNYSFMIGATEKNIDSLKDLDPTIVPAVKLFMGNSTGNMAIEKSETLSKLFATCPVLIAAHCEDDKLIQANLALEKLQFGDKIEPIRHMYIRSDEVCYSATRYAVNLAKKHNTRLHVLHVSSEKEIDSILNLNPIGQKLITGEACIHHLMFCEEDYISKGNLIKVNPSIKTKRDRKVIWDAIRQGKLDTIASDHAPHLWEEKQKEYLEAPSGGPMIQFMLPLLLDEVSKGNISITKLVELMSHNPSKIYNIQKRGFIRVGYYADLTLIDLARPQKITKDIIFSKCGWSALENKLLSSRVSHTIINGHIAFEEGKVSEDKHSMELRFAPPIQSNR